MLQNKQTNNSIRSRITIKGRRMRALLSAEGLRKSKIIQTKRKGWKAIIEATTIPQEKIYNPKTNMEQDVEGFTHVQPGQGAKVQQPPTSLLESDTSEANPFSILATDETNKSMVIEEPTPNNNNTNKSIKKNNSTTESINITDNNEFLPLIWEFL